MAVFRGNKMVAVVRDRKHKVTLFFHLHRIVTACVLAAAVFLVGCQNTTTEWRGNGLVVGSKEIEPKSKSPLPRDTVLVRAPKAPLAPAPKTIPLEQVAVRERIVLTPPRNLDTQVRVGLLLPLSGPRSSVGQALLDAALLAVFDIANENFVLVPIDTKGSPDGAEIAAQEAIAAGVKLVIGPVFSDSVRSAAPTILDAGLNMIAFSNNRSVAQPGVFLSGLLPETQIDRVVRFASSRGLQRIGALIPSGPFGASVIETLRLAAMSTGMEITRIREYGNTPEEIAAAIRAISDYDNRRNALVKLREVLKGREDEGSRSALERLNILETLGPIPFDALLVAASGDDLVNAAAQLGNYDIDTKRTRILGTSAWAIENTGREPSLVGAWFATPPLDAASEFSIKFRDMFEARAPAIASSAYDLVALAAILGSGDGGPKYDRDTLTSETGFAGVGGLFRFTSNGLVERSLEMREVQNRGSRILDPAQEQFNVPNN